LLKERIMTVSKLNEGLGLDDIGKAVFEDMDWKEDGVWFLRR
jgi:hypothetical protein